MLKQTDKRRRTITLPTQLDDQLEKMCAEDFSRDASSLIARLLAAEWKRRRLPPQMQWGSPAAAAVAGVRRPGRPSKLDLWLDQPLERPCVVVNNTMYHFVSRVAVGGDGTMVSPESGRLCLVYGLDDALLPCDYASGYCVASKWALEREPDDQKPVALHREELELNTMIAEQAIDGGAQTYWTRREAIEALKAMAAEKEAA
jgi:hypothetical protein